jgi:flagellar hook-associated protein 3 FlgL
MITKPSDSPAGTVTSLALRSRLKQYLQYQANATDAIGWLSTVDTAYSSITAQLQQVRSLVVQAMNAGTSNEALAQQVDQASIAVLSLANSSYLGRPIFGGTTAATVAFDSTGGYVGDTGAVIRMVGPDTSVQLNTPGTTGFGPEGNNVFVLLRKISNDLRTNPAELGADLTALDERQTAITADKDLAGAKYAQIQGVQASIAADAIELKSQLSNLEDVDLAQIAAEVSSANVCYQASLATAAKISQISLLDFLR